jgi:y4mF family transcriptional regulator
MAKSSDAPGKPSQADRIRRAAGELRALSAGTAVNAGRVISATVAVPKSESHRGAPRQVRFPKETDALRQYVAAVRERAPDIKSVQLRMDRPASLAVRDRLDDGPSAGLRLRADDARLATALHQGAAVSRLPKMATVSPALEGVLLTTSADLGRLVRERRRQLRLNQAELADLAGTGRRFISDLEAGKPTLELGRALVVCHVLGVRLVAEVASHGR